MEKRWNFGALLALFIFHLLNYKGSSHDFEGTSTLARKELDERNLEANIAPNITKPPETNKTISPHSIPAHIITNHTQNSNSPKTSNPTNNSSQISTQSGSRKKSNLKWVYFMAIPLFIFLVSTIFCTILICKKKGVATIGPWRTGISGQLQKAFVSGVPRLNKIELENACEEFSNIIATYPQYTVFKGTLSSGVEIAVSSTNIKSINDWSQYSELCFRKKIEMLTRINHKNFMNLLGFCEENEPFTRMMVFEYAPNGPLYEHLHVEGNEPLDWNARMRIIMGIAYCLQYMHGLEPSISHPNLSSSSVFLTEDFAAKVGDESIWSQVMKKEIKNGDENMNIIESKYADVANNIYSFGILLLEIITGKNPYLALECINENENISQLIDPLLKSYKLEDINVICKVIQECIQMDVERRPKMSEIVEKLRGVLVISPESAKPRLSPLWWAELEILSV